MAESTVSAFLKRHVTASALAFKSVTALKTIRESNGYKSHATRIRALLREPTTGAGLAKHANNAWLVDVFSSRRVARRFLRQALAPGDKAAGEPTVRGALVDRMKPLLTGRPDGNVAAVLGDEGTGKSWLFAQSWLSLKEKPLIVVFTADDFAETSSTGDLTKSLIDKLIAQTSGRVSKAACTWWRRKLNRWHKAGRQDTPSLVVVIDGLNQRPQTDWGQIIDAMSFEIDRIGGRLIITARTAYYSSRVKRRLLSPIPEVNVPEWADAERKAIFVRTSVLGILPS